MRICRKCSKEASDDSKICRDCGAILEDVPDDLTSDAPDAKSSRDWPVPAAAEWQEAGPDAGAEPIDGRPKAEWDDEPVEADPAAWRCSRCGEMVLGTFEVCWRCLTAKGGEPAEPHELDVLQETADVALPDEEPQPVELDAETLGVEEAVKKEDAVRQDQSKRPPVVCPRCGSSKMMFDVTVQDQGDSADRQLRVVVFGDPSALLFKDRLYGTLTADICGECGHAELYVVNPRELYRHYRKSLQ